MTPKDDKQEEETEEVKGEDQTEETKRKGTYKLPIEVNEDSPKHVVFLTSDFAMQNVIIQLGFTLLTLDGFRLTRVKRYKLLCRACYLLNLDTERKFCDRCGSHMLGKVSVFINDSGEITYFDNPKRRINLKGTKFSLPKPKFGRHAPVLILRED